MRVRVFQHVPFETTGSIGAWLDRRGVEPAATRFFAGELPPARPDADLLVVMGGPMGVNDRNHFPWLGAEIAAVAAAVAEGRRVLGVCLGAQVIAAALGARVFANPVKEIGWFPVHRAPGARQGRPGEPREPGSVIPGGMPVFHWHGETFDLPAGARLLLSSPGCAHQAFGIGTRVVGLQFHLEMTVEGARSLAENCPGDLAPGPWTQPAPGITADPTLFAAAHRVMDELLDLLVEGVRP